MKCTYVWIVESSIFLENMFVTEMATQLIVRVLENEAASAHLRWSIYLLVRSLMVLLSLTLLFSAISRRNVDAAYLRFHVFVSLGEAVCVNARAGCNRNSHFCKHLRQNKLCNFLFMRGHDMNCFSYQ